MWTLKKLRALVSSEKASCEEAGIQFVHGAGHHKPPQQRAYEKLSALLEKWEGYEKKLFTMGNYRNSYSKTDPDAAFMHMKEDHMFFDTAADLLQWQKRVQLSNIPMILNTQPSWHNIVRFC